MIVFDVGDVAILTGPLDGTNLEQGEVVEILAKPNKWGAVYVYGRSSGNQQFVQASSLSTWEDICNDDSVVWGDANEDGEIELSIPVTE